METNTAWITQYLSTSDEKRTLSTPKFKYCKKRNDTYSTNFEEIWYKTPYKYHLQFETKDEEEVSLQLVHEDMSEIETSSTLQPIEILESSNKNQIVTIKFHFNVCSYKRDGRKFRLKIILHKSEKPFCCLISPPFVIKAKKPIIAKGAKRKRILQQEENEGKKRKIETIRQGSGFQPVKTQKKSVASAETVDKLLSFIDQMSRWEQKYLLCKMIEKCQQQEKDFVKSKYFEQRPVVVIQTEKKNVQ